MFVIFSLLGSLEAQLPFMWVHAPGFAKNDPYIENAEQVAMLFMNPAVPKWTSNLS